jgi:hypothetical protein
LPSYLVFSCPLKAIFESFEVHVFPVSMFLFILLFLYHCSYFSLSIRNDNCVFLLLSGWETIPESKELTPEKDFSKEESTSGVLIERFPVEGSSECEDSLESQQKNHEKHFY